MWLNPAPGSKIRLFEKTPKSKFSAFDKPVLILEADGRKIKEWKDIQSFYFYPYSVLDFLGDKETAKELRLITPNRKASIVALKEFKKSLVRFEDSIDSVLINKAQEYGCKTSLIYDLERINNKNAKLLSKLDLLIVRVKDVNASLSVLKGVPNRNLLSGVRVYLNEDKNDFLKVAEEAKKIGLNFIHVSKKLRESRQAYLTKSDVIKIRALKKLQSDTFRVILPRNLHTVYNEKFVISKKYNNSRDCAFFEHRKVLYRDRFYPCYTKSILKKKEFSSKTIKGLEKKASMFGKKCSDCACIYENDLFADIKKATMPNEGHYKFYLKYK